MTKRPMACDSYKIFFNNINDPQTWSSSSWMEPVSTICSVMMRQTNGGDYSFMRSIAAAALIIIDYFLSSTLMIPIEETRIHPLMGQSRTMLTFTGPYIYIYILTLHMLCYLHWTCPQLFVWIYGQKNFDLQKIHVLALRISY